MADPNDIRSLTAEDLLSLTEDEIIEAATVNGLVDASDCLDKCCCGWPIHKCLLPRVLFRRAGDPHYGDMCRSVNLTSLRLKNILYRNAVEDQFAIRFEGWTDRMLARVPIADIHFPRLMVASFGQNDRLDTPVALEMLKDISTEATRDISINITTCYDSQTQPTVRYLRLPLMAVNMPIDESLSVAATAGVTLEHIYDLTLALVPPVPAPVHAPTAPVDDASAVFGDRNVAGATIAAVAPARLEQDQAAATALELEPYDPIARVDSEQGDDVNVFDDDSFNAGELSPQKAKEVAGVASEKAPTATATTLDEDQENLLGSDASQDTYGSKKLIVPDILQLSKQNRYGNGVQRSGSVRKAASFGSPETAEKASKQKRAPIASDPTGIDLADSDTTMIGSTRDSNVGIADNDEHRGSDAVVATGNAAPTATATTLTAPQKERRNTSGPTGGGDHSEPASAPPNLGSDQAGLGNEGLAVAGKEQENLPMDDTSKENRLRDGCNGCPVSGVRKQKSCTPLTENPVLQQQQENKSDGAPSRFMSDDFQANDDASVPSGTPSGSPTLPVTAHHQSGTLKERQLELALSQSESRKMQVRPWETKAQLGEANTKIEDTWNTRTEDNAQVKREAEQRQQLTQQELPSTTVSQFQLKTDLSLLALEKLAKANEDLQESVDVSVREKAQVKLEAEWRHKLTQQELLKQQTLLTATESQLKNHRVALEELSKANEDLQELAARLNCQLDHQKPWKRVMRELLTTKKLQADLSLAREEVSKANEYRQELADVNARRSRKLEETSRRRAWWTRIALLTIVVSIFLFGFGVPLLGHELKMQTAVKIKKVTSWQAARVSRQRSPDWSRRRSRSKQPRHFPGLGFPASDESSTRMPMLVNPGASAAKLFKPSAKALAETTKEQRHAAAIKIETEPSATADKEQCHAATANDEDAGAVLPVVEYKPVYGRVAETRDDAHPETALSVYYLPGRSHIEGGVPETNTTEPSATADKDAATTNVEDAREFVKKLWEKSGHLLKLAVNATNAFAAAVAQILAKRTTLAPTVNVGNEQPQAGPSKVENAREDVEKLWETSGPVLKLVGDVCIFGVVLFFLYRAYRYMRPANYILIRGHDESLATGNANAEAPAEEGRVEEAQAEAAQAVAESGAPAAEVPVWEVAVDPRSPRDLFYYCRATGVSQFDKPPEVPPWELAIDPSGTPYYYCPATGASLWVNPPAQVGEAPVAVELGAPAAEVSTVLERPALNNDQQARPPPPGAEEARGPAFNNDPQAWPSLPLATAATASAAEPLQRVPAAQYAYFEGPQTGESFHNIWSRDEDDAVAAATAAEHEAQDAADRLRFTYNNEPANDDNV